MSEFLVVEV
jgi:hypothetical protein